MWDKDKVEREYRKEKEKKEKRRRGIWTFYCFGLPGETVLLNGPKKLL
jgi:endonuclease YncB( thermonuclease family)